MIGVWLFFCSLSIYFALSKYPCSAKIEWSSEFASHVDGKNSSNDDMTSFEKIFCSCWIILAAKPPDLARVLWGSIWLEGSKNQTTWAWTVNLQLCCYATWSFFCRRMQGIFITVLYLVHQLFHITLPLLTCLQGLNQT